MSQTTGTNFTQWKLVLGKRNSDGLQRVQQRTTKGPRESLVLGLLSGSICWEGKTGSSADPRVAPPPVPPSPLGGLNPDGLLHALSGLCAMALSMGKRV